MECSTDFNTGMVLFRSKVITLNCLILKWIYKISTVRRGTHIPFQCIICVPYVTMIALNLTLNLLRNIKIDTHRMGEIITADTIIQLQFFFFLIEN